MDPGTVIKMNDKGEGLVGTAKSQQEKIENLTERVIRLETALEIALSRSLASRTDAAQLELKD